MPLVPPETSREVPMSASEARRPKPEFPTTGVEQFLDHLALMIARARINGSVYMANDSLKGMEKPVDIRDQPGNYSTALVAPTKPTKPQ
jgi:hypothetical protein